MSTVDLERLGRYEVVGTLGRGAMGTVYDGRDPGIDRRVAIKTLPLHGRSAEETAEELARFKREAQAAGRLHHPNVVGVYDYGETADVAFIVMEFVDGVTLKSLFDSGERMAPADAVRLMQGLLAGMQYCHERGVVHRDIKPGNVMLARDGTLKITDFGIARIESSVLTQAGTVMGTPAYMSPEQVNGETVDARSDIYSAGVLLYQLLTGEKPFDGSMATIMHKVLNTVPPPPSALSVNAPARLDAVVATAMAKRPDQRFQTAADFSAALAHAFAAPAEAGDGTLIAPREAAEAGTVVFRPEPARAGAPSVTPAAPPPAPPPPAKPGSRTPLLAGIGVLAVLAVAGGAYVALRPSPPPPQPAPPAVVTQEPAKPSPAPAPPPPEIKTAQPEAPPPTPPPSQSAAPAPAPTPATPVAPASPPAPPPPDPAAIRAALAAALGPIDCALLRAAVAPSGDVQVGGVSGSSRLQPVVDAVADAAPHLPATVRVVSLQDDRYCPVLDTLRPLAPVVPSGTDPTLALTLASGDVLLHRGGRVIPRVVMPDFPAYLTLAAFVNDGSIAAQVDFQGSNQPLAPGEALTIGDPAPPAGGRNRAATIPDQLKVDEPFGNDLLVAVASERPLFDHPRDAEPPEALAAALSAAIARERQAGHKLAASAVVIRSVRTGPH